MVLVESATKVYGDVNPKFKATYSGFKDGDTEKSLLSPVTFSVDADNCSKVGEYEIVASGAISEKYEISYISGTLTITKAPLTISAGTYTKKQGEVMPEFKASYAGFKNGEEETVLHKQPKFFCEATEVSAPADYIVFISGAEADNYDISYEQGRLTIVEADAIIIRAKSYSRVYGEQNPVFEFETEGAVLVGEPKIICSADRKSKVGTYKIELGEGTVKNYNVTFVPGTLTISKAPLVVTANDYTITQGDDFPEFTASYSGFMNGEDETVLSKLPVLETIATEASEPGKYPITLYGIEADNYEVVNYVAGTFTIRGRELIKQTITWNQKIKAKVGSMIIMNATASSGLPIRYSYVRPQGVESAYHIPQIEGNEITLQEEGMYMLVAIQDGNYEYAAATDTMDFYAVSNDVGLMYVDGIYYKYTDDQSALKVVMGYEPYRGKVEIPASVNGLPVSQVDDYAMYACYYLQEVVVGDNVKRYGREAFGANVNLTKVTLSLNSLVLDNYVFNCDDAIEEIHSRSAAPYAIDECAFNGYVDYDKCILYVPVGARGAYMNADIWRNFTHIVEEEVPTNISHIGISDKNAWYTLQGVKQSVKPSKPGVYVHNGKKVIVR